MNNKFYSLSQAATILKCKTYRITYLITTGQIPEPKIRLANRRAFTMEEISKIKEVILA